MPIWKRHVGVLGMVLVLIGICSIGVAQVDVTFPWTQPGSYTGNAIDFGAVPVGQTKTATYTFKILETSETSATVTIIRPNSPFGSDAPIEPFTLAPGQSITFNVTFTPPAVGDYTGYFTITARGGRPLVTKRQTVTLTGNGTSSGAAPLEGTWGPTEPDDVAKLEAKLDAVEIVLGEFRQKLDNLGWWLGKLTVGWGIGIEPHSTNPIPQTNIWEQLAKLEAKLDELSAQPGGTTIIEIYNIIVQINVLIVNFNQLIVNIGGDVDKLEAKLDQLQDDIKALQESNDRIEDKLDQLLLMLMQPPSQFPPGVSGSPGGKATGTGFADDMDCSKIEVTVYQQGDQWLMKVFGKPGAIPVRWETTSMGSSYHSPMLRVNGTYFSPFQISNTNSVGAFGTEEGIVLTKFELPFWIEVRYMDLDTGLYLAPPCLIQF